MSRTCATTRWSGRPGISSSESGLGATELLSGASGVEGIVRLRACARAGRCAASTNGALGRDDLNRRGGRTELDRGFTSRRRATAFTRKHDYEDTDAFTEKRVTPLRYIAAAKFWPCIIFLRSANLACTIRALVTQGFAWTIHSRYYRDIINRQLVRKFDLQKVLTKYVAIAQLGERQTEDSYVSSVVTISEIWRSRVRSAVATPFFLAPILR